MPFTLVLGCNVRELGVVAQSSPSLDVGFDGRGLLRVRQIWQLASES
jgi:hypothetical protein